MNFQTFKSSCSNISIGFVHVIAQILVIFLISIIYLNIFHSLHFFSVFFYIIVLFVIGTRMRSIGNMMHECCHSSFVPSKKGNRVIGTFISILDITSFSEYQKNHFLHHRHVGMAGLDEDFDKSRFLLKPFQKKKMSPAILFFILMNPLNWFYYAKCCFKVKEKNTIIYIWKLIYLCIFLPLCFYINPKLFFFFFVVPYFTTYQMMKIFSDILDHAFSDEKTQNHFFKIKILNLIFFPRNDAYHLVHHLFPRAPVCEFKKIHEQLLLQQNEYGKLKHKLF